MIAGTRPESFRATSCPSPASATTTCADRPGFEERLRQHGIRYTVAQVPQTGQTQLFFEDPAGNGVELNFDGA